MSLFELAFYAFAALVAGSGFLLAISKRLVYALFLLFALLFGMAGLYVFAGANFLGLTQIIVYVGGILVLLMFGVMLTQKIRSLRPETQVVNFIPGLIGSAGLFVALTYLIREVGPSLPDARDTVSEPTSVETIGKATVTDFLLPFELISILLLVALIGTAWLSRRAPSNEQEP